MSAALGMPMEGDSQMCTPGCAYSPQVCVLPPGACPLC